MAHGSRFSFVTSAATGRAGVWERGIPAGPTRPISGGRLFVLLGRGCFAQRFPDAQDGIAAKHAHEAKGVEIAQRGTAIQWQTRSDDALHSGGGGSLEKRHGRAWFWAKQQLARGRECGGGNGARTEGSARPRRARAPANDNQSKQQAVQFDCVRSSPIITPWITSSVAGSRSG